MGYFNSQQQQPMYSAGLLPCEPFPECLAPPFTITVGEKDQTQPTQPTQPVKDESKTKDIIVAILVATIPTVLGGYLLYVLTKENKSEKQLEMQVREPVPKNRTYEYAKNRFVQGRFPSTRIVYQLDEYWIEDDSFKLLDGPFKTKSMAESHVSKSIDKAIKASR